MPIDLKLVKRESFLATWRSQNSRIVALALILVLTAYGERRYSVKELEKIREFSRANNSSFLLHDDLGALLLISSGELTDVLEYVPGFRNPWYRTWPALSHDGKKVAFSQGPGSLLDLERQGEEIWIFDVTERKASKITNVPFVMALSWCPQDRRLALNAGAGKLQILSLETREFRTLATDIASDAIPSWSPDGQKIVYHTESELASKRVFHVKVIDVATGASEVVAEGSQPSWSSKGDQIAFLDMQAQRFFSVSDRGAEERLLFKAPGWNSGGPLAAAPVLWSRDQKSVIYDAFYDGGVQAVLVDLSTRKERILTTGRPLVVVDWK